MKGKFVQTAGVIYGVYLIGATIWAAVEASNAENAIQKRIFDLGLEQTIEINFRHMFIAILIFAVGRALVLLEEQQEREENREILSSSNSITH